MYGYASNQNVSWTICEGCSDTCTLISNQYDTETNYDKLYVIHSVSFFIIKDDFFILTHSNHGVLPPDQKKMTMSTFNLPWFWGNIRHRANFSGSIVFDLRAIKIRRIDTVYSFFIFWKWKSINPWKKMLNWPVECKMG